MHNSPICQDLVLLGGGHSHVIVIKSFGMRPMPGVRLTVISRDVHTPYSGMLPGFIAGHYSFDQTHIDLNPLCRFAKARLLHDEVCGLDLSKKQVLCKNHPPIAYDVLSLNIGSSPSMDRSIEKTQHTTAVKPINNFLQRWEVLKQRLTTAKTRQKIAVVGAGAGGVELLLAMHYALPNNPEFHLFSASYEILPTHNARVRKKFLRILNTLSDRVHIHTNQRVVSNKEMTLTCSDGSEFPMDEVLWVTQAGAASWLGKAGLAVDEQGFVKVHDTLESVSHPGVFAAGDVAAVENHPREKAGVFAVRHGKPLDNNLRAKLNHQPCKPFNPQKKFLSIISTGNKYAVAARGRWALEGRIIWKWKDHIDRKFMRKFHELPQMNETAMHCAGCGSKMGPMVLQRVLARLTAPAHADILVGLDKPDDAAVIEIPENQLLVQTVDFFPALVQDPYLFGKIAANHCLNDLFAMGAKAHSALAIATIPYSTEEKAEETLTHLLQGAVEVLDAAQARLIGGHTTEGEELALGFSLNGLAQKPCLLYKSGMQPEDMLILTKPLGTGTLFAAEMRLATKGRYIDQAIASMLFSNQAAAESIHEFAVHACTDISGFGLAGHLLEMCIASQVDAAIFLDLLPMLAGCQETLAKKIFSSLYPQNLQQAKSIAQAQHYASHPKYPLLFDPQTSGGLLLSIDPSQANQCIKHLHGLGYQHASIIGRVEKMKILEPRILVIPRQKKACR